MLLDGHVLKEAAEAVREDRFLVIAEGVVGAGKERCAQGKHKPLSKAKRRQ